MGKLTRGLVWASSSVIFVVLYNLGILGGGALIVALLTYWGVPEGLLKLLGVAAYLGWTLTWTIVGLKFGARIFGPPGSGRRFTFDPARYETPFWKRIRRYGTVPLAVLATWIASSAAAAVLIRSLGFTGWRAWAVALTADAIAALIFVASFLGLLRLF